MINQDFLNGDVLDLPSITGDKYNNGQPYSAYRNDFSNADAKVSPEMIQAGLATTTAIVSGISKNRASQGVCKRPLVGENFLNRKKWSEYRLCLQRESEKQQRELEIAQAQAQAAANQSGNRDMDLSGGDKILGMPKGLAIGIGVALGLAIAGFITYKIVKAKRG